MLRKYGRIALAAGALVALASAFPASAKPPPGSAPVAQGPFLDPHTGSYFELRVDNFRRIPGGHDHARWADAEWRAAGHSYKGRRGRLAIIRDRQTLDFIADHFRINEATWIGLRFFCKYRKLMWVNGEIRPLSKNRLWARPWYRNHKIRCSNQNFEYMPVYLTRDSFGPVRWQASGQQKYFTSYLIEYPAPPKAEKKPDKKAENGPAPKR